MTTYQNRRTIVVALGSGLLSACSTAQPAQVLAPEEQRIKQKFRGINGVATRIDAANIKKGVSITTERGVQIDGSATLSPKNVKHSSYAYESMPIPLTIRATWRVGEFEYTKRGWIGGTIVGDYTVRVADRIPDALLDEIKKNGGGLRLKIRLVDEGILIGWDIERMQPGYATRYEFPGGDFSEAKIYNGKIVNKGWYIDKSGNKVETDY